MDHAQIFTDDFSHLGHYFVKVSGQFDFIFNWAEIDLKRPPSVLFNYLEILFDFGQKHQKNKRRAFQRIGKRFMLRMPSRDATVTVNNRLTVTVSPVFTGNHYYG